MQRFHAYFMDETESWTIILAGVLYPDLFFVRMLDSYVCYGAVSLLKCLIVLASLFPPPNIGVKAGDNHITKAYTMEL